MHQDFFLVESARSASFLHASPREIRSSFARFAARGPRPPRYLAEPRFSRMVPQVIAFSNRDRGLST